MKIQADETRYLNQLAHEYPSPEAVSEAIINLKARLELPKGTEHFISDIHGEYDGLYARFADLLDTNTSEVDLRPMVHVADAFTLGKRLTSEPFEF